MTAHTYTKRLGAFAMVFAAGLFAAACDSSPSPVAPTPAAPAAPTVSTVVVTRGSASTPGVPIQLTATAQMTDATTRDVTGAAVWQSSNSAAATVSSTGMVTVVGGGELDVGATYQNISGSLHLLTAALPVVAITVNGPAELSSPFQLTAIARLSDGSMQDVTQSSHWQSSEPQRATVTGSGYVAIVAAGEVDFLATFKGVTGSLHVTISMPRAFLLSGAIVGAGPNGQPIAGARVQVFSNVTEHLLSDAQGLFAIRIPAGSTIIEVTKDGYETWSALVDIGADTKLAVVLSPTPLSSTPPPTIRKP